MGNESFPGGIAMIRFRISTAAEANPQLQEVPEAGLSNVEWLRKHGGEYLQEGSLLLLGGSSSPDFRVRVAQSHARSDMLPSLWSHVAVLTERQGQSWSLSEVSLTPPQGFGDVPIRNARQENTLDHYADPLLWCNIALLSFPIDAREVHAGMQRLSRDRGIVDLGELIVPWLAFVWGVGSAPNPLLQDKGLPCAVYVETVMSIAGLELTPGLSSQSSCPEAIWQSAKWWYQFYAQTDGSGQLPKGIYMLRQVSAAAIDLGSLRRSPGDGLLRARPPRRGQRRPRR
jgi:hypothetical protein